MTRPLVVETTRNSFPNRGRIGDPSCIAVWVCVLLSATENLAVAQEASKPAYNAREQQTEFTGPGRDLPPPDQLAEIRIGYFGPGDSGNPRAGDMWRAAQLAIAEANAAGGYSGKPFRLLPVWSEDPWGTGIRQLTRLVYEQQVWAIVGGIDGPSTHLAEQVVLKARLPLVSPVSTDKTVNLANVPWMFSLAPGDHLCASPLAAEIDTRVASRAIVLIATNDHDSQLAARELAKPLAASRNTPRFRYDCRPGIPEADVLIDQVLAHSPHAALLIAGADDSAKLVKALRAAGFAGPVFGGPAMGRLRFQELIGRDTEGIFFPMLSQSGPSSVDFRTKYQQAHDRAPDFTATLTYDAVRMVVEAFRKSGPNRARLRDSLVQLSPWQGVSGKVHWDGLGANTRSVKMGTIRDGRVIPAPRLPAPDASPTHSAPR